MLFSRKLIMAAMCVVGAVSGAPATAAQHVSLKGSFQLKVLAMKTQHAGWAVGTHAILVTNDGGRQWQNVTPPHVRIHATGPVPISQSTVGAVWDFRTAQSAWVVTSVNTAQGTFLLNYSTSTGRHWTHIPFRLNEETPGPDSSIMIGSHPVEVDFVNPRVGWLLISPGAAGPQFPIELWQTTTGGHTWHRVYATNALGGMVSFTNTTSGWLVVPQPSNTQQTLFQLKRTTTSGRTWQSVAVPTLPTFQNIAGSCGIMMGWQGTSGLIPGDTPNMPNGGYAAVLRTTNGGRRWFLSPKLYGRGPGFFTVDTAGATVWAANNGRLETLGAHGQRWIQQSRPSFLRKSTGLDVVNRSVGFVWQNTTEGVHMWRSTDAGTRWTPMISKILPS